MFESHQQYTGTRYTLTIAFLSLGLVFSPAALIVSGSFGYVSVTSALSASLLFLTLSAISSRYRRMTSPSLVAYRSAELSR